MGMGKFLRMGMEASFKKGMEGCSKSSKVVQFSILVQLVLVSFRNFVHRMHHLAMCS